MLPDSIYKLIAGMLSRPMRQNAFTSVSRVISALLVCVALFGVYGPSPACARLRHGQEYQVKAAFLFNFANFVEWPDEAFANGGKHFVICVIGNDPFKGALDALKGKTLKGRTVVVRYCAEAGDARNANILYISSSERGNVNHIVKSLKGSPVLTVGDQEGFCQVGGMINMTKMGSRIGFEIDVSAARRAGLRISSHLLKLAKEVIQ